MSPPGRPKGEYRSATREGTPVNLARAAFFALLFMLCCSRALACGEALGGATRTIEGASYTVVWKTVPDPIQVGAHFTVDFAVCPRAAAEAPRAVRVDATMPEHRHGMNYRPVVSASSAASYRAEGLLFHMPGRWAVTFDVEGNGRSERLTSVLQLE